LKVTSPKPTPNGIPRRRETLAVFSGPTVTSHPPSTSIRSRSHWNYIAIHAYGTLQLVEDEAGKNALLEGLIEAHEPAFLQRWHAFPKISAKTCWPHRRLPHSHRRLKQIQAQPEPCRRRTAKVHAAMRRITRSASPCAWMERLGND